MKTNTALFLLSLLCLTGMIELSQAAAQEQGRNLGKGKKSKKGSKKKADNTIIVASEIQGQTRDWANPPNVGAGDRTIFDDPLYYYNPYTEMMEGPEIGRSRGVCTALAAPPNAMTAPVFQCVGTFVFYDVGKITIVGDYQPFVDTNSVTGGTGHFKGATGEVKITGCIDRPINVFEISLDDY